jgi:hypothetical protein
MPQYIRIIPAVLLVLTAGACTREEPIVEVKGGCADVFSAQVCTWARTRGTTLVEAGAVVPIASIENAPAEQPMAWPPAAAAEIDMPAPVLQQAGLTQLTMYWEPHGHPPGPFMTPHFDFHFYTIPAAERAAMDCHDLTKPANLPAGYDLPDIPLPPEVMPMMGVSTLVGLCVPQMGMHALPLPDIQRQDAFGGSMVVGYYQGAPIFIEPMISKAMLLEKQSFDLAIPDIPGLTGMHPTVFRAEYDAAQQAYRFTFSGFTGAT